MNPQEKHAHDCERSLFAGVLIDPAMLDQVCQITTGAEFLDKTIGKAFDLVADRHAARLPVGDITILVGEFRKAGLLELMGGMAGIGKLVQHVPTASNVTYHAEEIHRLFRLRRLSAAVSGIEAEAESIDADPDALVARMDAKMTDVASTGNDEAVSLASMMNNLADQLDRDRERGVVSGVSTGFEAIDESTGGMFPGDLVILAARTSIGKTAMGMQMAMNAAKSGHAVLVMSLEMNELSLAQRIAAGQLGLSMVDQRTGGHTSHDSRRIREYAESHRDTKLMIKPSRRATVFQISGYARAIKATRGLSLIVIDYLQLIASRDRQRSRYEQVSEISGELKTLATELDVPVLALAQLNRQGEGETPKLSYLRESGSIEQDADAVWFLHRERGAKETQFIVEKNRQGPRGVFDLRFDDASCEFKEPEVFEHPNYHSEFEEYA